MHPGFITQKSPLRSTTGWWVWPNSRMSAQLRQPLRLVQAAIVAVAGHPQQRDLGIPLLQPLGVPHAVPQMQDHLGLHPLHALLHRLHAPVGIG